MQAQRVIRLLTPKVLMVSVKSPIEPPPEIGRIKAKGRSSGGKFITERTGYKKCESASISPDSRSIADADKIAISGGRIETTVESPFSTPKIKVLYGEIPFFSARAKTKIIRVGIT